MFLAGQWKFGLIAAALGLSACGTTGGGSARLPLTVTNEAAEPTAPQLAEALAREAVASRRYKLGTRPADRAVQFALTSIAPSRATAGDQTILMRVTRAGFEPGVIEHDCRPGQVDACARALVELTRWQFLPQAATR